jgi:hypothetical protein
VQVIYVGQFEYTSTSASLYPIAITVVLFIAFTSIVFCLPELDPVDFQTLTYTHVAVVIVLTYSTVYPRVLGLIYVPAGWFAGPIKQIAGAPPALVPALIVWMLIKPGQRWALVS